MIIIIISRLNDVHTVHVVAGLLALENAKMFWAKAKGNACSERETLPMCYFGKTESFFEMKENLNVFSSFVDLLFRLCWLAFQTRRPPSLSLVRLFQLGIARGTILTQSDLYSFLLVWDSFNNFIIVVVVFFFFFLSPTKIKSIEGVIYFTPFVRLARLLIIFLLNQECLFVLWYMILVFFSSTSHILKWLPGPSVT